MTFVLMRVGGISAAILLIGFGREGETEISNILEDITVSKMIKIKEEEEEVDGNVLKFRDD